ncbi:MAG: 4Fe-4S binding protein [Candidatus Omnitrophica bacterium]|nr:4Fe-4S binding protein [Candidatus Omnitrophota bacterium]
MSHSILFLIFLAVVFFAAAILIIKFWIIPARGFVQLAVFTLSEIGFICNSGIPCSNCLLSFGVCPIGALQRIAFIPGSTYIVLISLAVIGVIFGALTCGWLCPVGFIQDILHSLRIKKIKITNKLKIIRNFILFIAVILIFLELRFNLLSKNRIGIFEETTIFLGFALLLFAVFIKRPLCRIICPIGLIYGKLNSISPIKVNLDVNRCSGCSNCAKVCICDIEPRSQVNNDSCAKCFNCVKACNLR